MESSREKATAAPAESKPVAFEQIYCGGYVFYMSDGSHFPRVDVECVTLKNVYGGESSLSYSDKPVGGNKRKRSEDEDVYFDEEDLFHFHTCKETALSSGNFAVAYKCDQWCRLSDTQKEVLLKIQERVDRDQAENRLFTCAIIEGPGGCGKTRLMSHIMNHRPMNSLVMYLTKQNKRVQDFVHTDCLSGENDANVRKPIDLSPSTPWEINRIVQNTRNVGRYACTAEKFVNAVGGLSPRAFDKAAARVSRLGLDYSPFQRPRPTTGGRLGGASSHERSVTIMIDEYTMLQPPLIHAVACVVRKQLQTTPVLLLLGGDRFQCGPIGWGKADVKSTAGQDPDDYTNDIRHETRVKMNYEPLELKMENLQRCRGDKALGACVKRLRRVCEEYESRYSRKMVNLIVARYCVETGVPLFRKIKEDTSDMVEIRRVVPVDTDVLDFDGSGIVPAGSDQKPFDEYMAGLEKEEWDSRGVQFKYSPDGPVSPTYDLCRLVDHFTRLYTKLAEITFADKNSSHLLWTETVHESVADIRRFFPMIITLKNESCNKFAELFLLALSSKTRERVLEAPIPARLVDGAATKEAWTEHLRLTLRRCIRCLKFGDALQRQTLFVGMIYKMTSTFKNDPKCSLCNGEVVVLTSIDFLDDRLNCLESVTLRKLERDMDTDMTLRTGMNKNRMTGDRKMGIMPFVPHLSENIYQMQGNTIPTGAKCFVDLADVTCNSAYVAISRFQNSESITGIVITE